MKEGNVKTSTVANTKVKKVENDTIIGTLRYTETINLILEYSQTRKEKLLNQLMQKALNEKLKAFEYIELYNIDNNALKNIVLLKAPVGVMKEIVLRDVNFRSCHVLTKRMKDEPFDIEFASDATIEVKIWSVDYESEEVLVEKLITEKNKKVVDKILERLKNYNFSDEQIEKLLKAAFFKTRMHAVDYASKESLVKRLLVEENDDVSAKIIHFLKGYKFSRKEANELIALSKTYWMVRKDAAKYASKKNLIDALIKERYLDVISAIIKRLENFKITTNEGDRLMDSYSIEARKFAINYASDKKLLEVLLVEENFSIVYEIFERMKNYDFSKCKTEKFLNAPCIYTRFHFAKHASKDELINRLHVETNEDVETSIFNSLEKLGDLTQEEADKIIDLNVYFLLLSSYLLKYISDDKLVEIALKFESKPLNDVLLKSLEGKKLKKCVANKLLNAKSWEIRKYAIKYASKDKLLERLVNEKKEEVIVQILEMIE